MRWEIVRATALQAVVLVVMLSAARPEQAQDAVSNGSDGPTAPTE
jgi:hypothetical protein